MRSAAGKVSFFSFSTTASWKVSFFSFSESFGVFAEGFGDSGGSVGVAKGSRGCRDALRGGSAGDGASRKCDDEEAAALLFKTRKAFEEHLDGLDLDELLKLMRKSTYKSYIIANCLKEKVLLQEGTLTNLREQVSMLCSEKAALEKRNQELLSDREALLSEVLWPRRSSRQGQLMPRS